MRHLLTDIRFGVRMLLRYRTSSIASILTFGLGIGLATTVFSIVNGALYKGLPFEEADRLVAVTRADLGTRENLGDIAVHDFVVYEASQHVFESFGVWSVGSVNLVWGRG